MCKEKTPWEKTVEFHGHSCPGLAVGYRAATIAIKSLKELRSPDEELVAIVENDACGVDAIMLLAGCTLGKGNLLYRDYGKQVYTIGSRASNQAFRISINRKIWQDNDPARLELRKKVFGGCATAAEKKEFHAFQDQRTGYILGLPEEELCRVEKIDIKFPEKARIFNSVICSACGEPVMEARARLKDGQTVCIPCGGEYSRGW